jgi:hypothetical protein
VIRKAHFVPCALAACGLAALLALVRNAAAQPEPPDQEPARAEPAPDGPAAPEPTPADADPPPHVSAPAEAATPPPPAPDKKQKGRKKGQTQEPFEPTTAERGGKKRDTDRRKAGELTITGRVLARATLERQTRSRVDPSGAIVPVTVDSLDLSVPSARLGVKYEAPLPWLSAEVELEARNAKLKDAYVRARDRHFEARAGQFKMPISSLESTSIWTLPSVSRGFLNDLLIDQLMIGGRRPGVLFSARAREGVKPRLMLGAFQGSVVSRESSTARSRDLLEADSLKAQSPVARGEIQIGDMELGVSYEHRVGSPRVLETDHYWTLGADLTLDSEFRNGGLRLWLEGLSGASWFEHAGKPADAEDATFLSGRLLAAYRFGGTKKTELYVEPYGFFGAFDPDLEVTADFAWELALGVNVGFWRVTRLGLEAQLGDVDRNFPSAYLLGRDPKRRALLLQAGVAF